MLEAAAEVTDSAGELRLDAVAPSARRRRVVGLVENQEAARQEPAEPHAHRVGVSRVDQQVVRDEKAAMRAPRVHAKPAFAAHGSDVAAVEHLEDQAESLVQLGLPLL